MLCCFKGCIFSEKYLRSVLFFIHCNIKSAKGKSAEKHHTALCVYILCKYIRHTITDQDYFYKLQYRSVVLVLGTLCIGVLVTYICGVLDMSFVKAHCQYQ